MTLCIETMNCAFDNKCVLKYSNYSTHTKTWRFPSARLLKMDQSQHSNTALLHCDWLIGPFRAIER